MEKLWFLESCCFQERWWILKILRFFGRFGDIVLGDLVILEDMLVLEEGGFATLWFLSWRVDSFCLYDSSKEALVMESIWLLENWGFQRNCTSPRDAGFVSWNERGF